MNHKLSAVNLASCHKIANTEPFVLVIHKGESLVESLIKCAEITIKPFATLIERELHPELQIITIKT